NAPQQVDHLCDGCKNHFIQVLEYLDEMEVPYALNPRIVRGLDYYSRTTFEITPASDEEQGRQSALGGGGRYDDLVELIGGRPDTPAVGFASGIERLILQIKSKDLKVPSDPEVDVFLAQLGIEARKKALVLFEELKDAGFNIREGFSKKGLKNQLELADKLNAKLSLILGQKEILDGTIMVRDMEGGIQEVIDYKKIIPELEKRLKKVETIVVNDKIKEEK
ncbi:histidine--tRNA ligase, partial [bacterium]|nr:histidine--tRNA ligase [bacterium]